VTPHVYKPGHFVIRAKALTPSCGRLPMPIPKGTRLWQHLKPGRRWTALDLLELPLGRCRLGPACRPTCPLCDRLMDVAREAGVRYRAGLVWLPVCHYPMPRDWLADVETEGVHWPLGNWPRHVPPRPKMPVLVAHARGLITSNAPPAGPITPAAVAVFRVERVLYVTGHRDDYARLARACDAGVPITRLDRKGALML